MDRSRCACRGLILVGALLAAWGIPRPAHAETRTWTGAYDNDWFIRDNWDPAGLPDPTDDLIIDSGTPETADDVTTDGGGSITVAGGADATLSGTLYVGESGTGALTIEAGGQVSSADGQLGYYWSATGTAMVTGAGSTWTNSGDLYVGHDGAAALTVADGGLVTAKVLYASLSDLSGNGTITVQGGAFLDADLLFDGTHGLSQALPFGSGGTLNLDVDGTRILGVGYKDTGTLRIAEGRSVASTDGYLGCYRGSTGTSTVTGAGSTWTNSGDLEVGQHGTGTMRVEAGGHVSNASGYVGSDPDSTGAVAVTGPGSTWTNSGTLLVGYYEAVGTLTVEAGGKVSNTYGYVGWSGSSAGTATVTGAGSTWTNSGNLDVGRDGAGTLTVTDGGLVRVAGTLTIDYDEDDDGFIHMTSGGMLALFGDADDSLGDFLDLIGGTDAIRYWNDGISDWDAITHATPGVDYDLSYLTTGDLTGYTMLTVPEPATLALLAVGGLSLLACRSRKQAA